MTIEEQLDFLAKGTIDLIDRADLKSKIARGKPLTIKVGFDPTAPDIHLGHTVVIRKMKHFQQLGHRVVFVIGDFTGLIGDPPGKKITRPPLSREQIAENAETYKQQVFKILDPVATEVRFNSEWLSPLGAEALIKLAATYTLGRMLARDESRKRGEAQAGQADHRRVPRRGRCGGSGERIRARLQRASGADGDRRGDAAGDRSGAVRDQGDRVGEIGADEQRSTAARGAGRGLGRRR